jgi:predicted porin
MFGGVRAAGWATILAGGFIMVGNMPAAAADLGGNCCADLEERIAELEATTARKGNRKVSLTVSGWVNEAVFAWDDGSERNVYVGTNALEQSRFRFTGDAKITADVSAGFVLEIGVVGNNSNKWDQFSPSGTAASNLGGATTSTNGLLTIRKSNWYLKSKTYGQVAVGLNGMATYHLIDDADGANTRNVSDYQADGSFQGAFFVRRADGTLANVRWSDMMRGFDNASPGQSGRRNEVRYDSPSFQGFSIAAAWGEDDIWDAALTYKGDVGDFALIGKVGYGESTDEKSGFCGGTTPLVDYRCHWWGAGATVMHKPTGIYVYGGYGEQTIDDGLAAGLDASSTAWYVQPGIEHKWNPLGKTTIFGQYRHDEPGANPGKSLGADLDFWSGGVVQNVEAAAMNLYVIYRHADGSFIDATKGNTPTDIEAFDMVIGGAMIQF